MPDTQPLSVEDFVRVLDSSVVPLLRAFVTIWGSISSIDVPQVAQPVSEEPKTFYDFLMEDDP